MQGPGFAEWLCQDSAWAVAAVQPQQGSAPAWAELQCQSCGLGLCGKGDAMGTRGAGQGKEGRWEGGGIKHLLRTLEPLQRLKQVKSSSFNGNTSEITSCKPCVPVTAPSPQCPFVPATSLSAGRGANTRLRHRHQLPRIPKCFERGTAPSVSSALWSGRAQGEEVSPATHLWEQPACHFLQKDLLCGWHIYPRSHCLLGEGSFSPASVWLNTEC